MALYECSEGLVYKLWEPMVNRFVCHNMEFIRNKPYYVRYNYIYWIEDDNLYCKPYSHWYTLQNENLVGVREFCVTSDKIVTITQNYTIGVIIIYGADKHKFVEYGLPNTNLKIANLCNYISIKPDQIFSFKDFSDFSKYNGQNMLIHTREGYPSGEYNEYNEYVNARYKAKNMIDRNDELILYRKNNKLFIRDYVNGMKYKVPDDATLYTPNRVNVKSARSV